MRNKPGRPGKHISFLIIAGVTLIASSAWGQQFTPDLEYNNQPGLAAIKVYTGSSSNPSAYDSGYTGKDIKIGIIDSGINPSHVEFTSAIVAAMGWKRTSAELLTSDNWESVTGTGNFSSFLKDKKADMTTVDGHGSHVASIAAGRMDGVERSNNMMGVAYNSKLVVGTYVFNQCDTYDANKKCTKWKAYGLNDTQLSQTIGYVNNQGVKVINNSWGTEGGGADPAREHADFKANNPSTVAALKNALDKGAVIVFANGNDRETAGKGANPGAPSAMPTYDTAIAAYGAWITVAATNNAGTAIAGYSNYCGVAKNYCIAAPGGISSDLMNGADANKNDGYVGNYGTSMAAPVVSGAVALVAEKFPWMTNRNLATTILTTGSTASSPTTAMGRGLLDVSKAINGPGIFEEDFEANVPAGYAPTFSNGISGAYGIKKLGKGTLTLAGANTYTGSTAILDGTLKLSDDLAMPEKSPVSLSDVSGAIFDLNGAKATVGSLSGGGTNGGNITLGAGILTIKQAVNSTYAGIISDGGSGGAVVKTGGGAISLTGANTYTGGTQFNGGTIAANRDAGFGSSGGWSFDTGSLKYLASFNSSRAITLNAGGGAFDTNGFNSTLSGLIAGSGALTKNGAGTLNLTKDNSYTGNTTVNAGVLGCNNPDTENGSCTGTGNVYEKQNGKVQGTGRISGTYNNSGRVSPGNSTGRLTIGGAYVQERTGELVIEVSETEYDSLVVKGKVSLNGTLSTALLNGYRPQVGERIEKIVEAAVVSGQFSTLDTAVNSAGTLYFKPKYLASQVDIVMERDYSFNLQDRGFSPNQQAVGSMLNSVANTVTGMSGDLNNVLSSLDNLSSDSQLAAAMDQIAPRGDMAATVISQNAARVQTANISGRLQDLRAGMQGVSLRGLNFTIEQDEDLNRYGRPTVLAFNSDTMPEGFRMEGNENWGIFATGNATAGRIKDSSPQSDGAFRNVGVTVGTDYRFTRNLIAGIMAGYNRTRSDLDTNGSTAAISSYSLGAYGTYYRKGFYLDGLLNYGRNNTDKDRRIIYPGVDRTAASDQSGQTWSFSGGAGYDYPWRDWIFTPRLMVDYIRLATDDYTETGADSLNLQVNGQTSKVFLGQIGGTVTYVWKTDKATVLPRLWAMYGREFDAPDSLATTARLAMGSSSFTVFSVPPDQGFLNLGAGVTATLPRGTSLYLNLTGQVGQSNYYAYNLSVGCRIPF